MPHGNASRYTNNGCRCKPCREAASAQRARGRERRRHNAALNPSLIRHGTGAGYRDDGCRCGQCRAATAKEWREWKARHDARLKITDQPE